MCLCGQRPNICCDRPERRGGGAEGRGTLCCARARGGVSTAGAAEVHIGHLCSAGHNARSVVPHLAAFALNHLAPIICRGTTGALHNPICRSCRCSCCTCTCTCTCTCSYTGTQSLRLCLCLRVRVRCRSSCCSAALLLKRVPRVLCVNVCLHRMCTLCTRACSRCSRWRPEFLNRKCFVPRQSCCGGILDRYPCSAILFRSCSGCLRRVQASAAHTGDAGNTAQPASGAARRRSVRNSASCITGTA